jgi:hypothetical protein
VTRFEQVAEKCQVHESCVVIHGVKEGRRVWHSHMPDGVMPDVRLNLDVPVLDDARPGEGKEIAWRLAEQFELPLLGWDAEQHRRVAYATRERGLIGDQEIQAKTGVTRDQLDAEAKAKGWDYAVLEERRRAAQQRT